MSRNDPAQIDELDRLKRQVTGGGDAEMAFWRAAVRLDVWYVATGAMPLQGGQLMGVFSTSERAAAAGGEHGMAYVAYGVADALDSLSSMADHGVTGIVFDHPGPWIPLANLRILSTWLTEATTMLTMSPIVVAPTSQHAMEAYLESPGDATYAATLRALVGEPLLAVLDPDGDGTATTHIVNHRGERVFLAFTDSTRLQLVYGGKAVDVVEREGRELLTSIATEGDVLIVDAQHPSSFAAPAAWVRDILGPGSPAARPAQERKRPFWRR